MADAFNPPAASNDDEALPNLDQGFGFENWIVKSAMGVPYLPVAGTIPGSEAVKPTWGTTAALSLTVAHQEDEITTLRGMLRLREEQVVELRLDIAAANRQMEVLKTALLEAQEREERGQRRRDEDEPEWTAPMSLLPRGMR